MSKLRSEIIPQDPLINLMLRIISKQSVEFNELDNYYNDEHAFHTSTLDSSVDPNSWEDDVEIEDAGQLKISANINKSKQNSNSSNIWMILSVTSLLAICSAVYYFKGRKLQEFEDADSIEFEFEDADSIESDADADDGAIEAVMNFEADDNLSH